MTLFNLVASEKILVGYEHDGLKVFIGYMDSVVAKTPSYNQKIQFTL